MTTTQLLTGHLDEQWPDRHAAFTVEQLAETPDTLVLTKTEGPMFYAFAEFTMKRFVERLTDDKVVTVAETIRHLPMTYRHTGVYRLDADDEPHWLAVAEAEPGTTVVFFYQEDDEIIEVYRGVLGRNGLQPA